MSRAFQRSDGYCGGLTQGGATLAPGWYERRPWRFVTRTLGRPTAQPTNQTVYSGTTVTLSVGASGGSLTYLWYKDGQPLSSTTNSSLVLNNVSNADEGNYSVVVSNPAGVVASQAAQLTVVKLSSTIGLYPGITITGFIGSTQEIDYTLDINTNSGWTPRRNPLTRRNSHPHAIPLTAVTCA